jgi:hypothetical protein
MNSIKKYLTTFAFIATVSSISINATENPISTHNEWRKIGNISTTSKRKLSFAIYDNATPHNSSLDKAKLGFALEAMSNNKKNKLFKDFTKNKTQINVVIANDATDASLYVVELHTA